MNTAKTAYSLPKAFTIDPQFKDKTIVYHHIGATGGRTLSRALAKKFPKENCYQPEGNEFFRHYKDFLALPDRRKQKLQYIYGHSAFGIHTQLKQECNYISIIRNPIQQFISAYYFRRFYDPKHLQKETTDKYETVEECVNKHLRQRQQQYGEGYLVEAFSGNMQPWDNRPISDNSEQMNKDEKIAFVKKTTEQYFPFIGITELMDESLFVIAYKLGWDSVPFWHKVTSKRNYPFKVEEPSPSVLRKIIHLNEISIALYEIFTKKLVDEFEAIKIKFPEIEDWMQEYKQQRLLAPIC